MGNFFLNPNSRNTFVPERLIEAREARGLSQTDLEERCGIKHQMISRYETGKSTPTPDNLEKLSEVLNFPISFFYKRINKDNLETVFFRGRSAASKKTKLIHTRRIRWIEEIYDYLEQYINFPEVKVPRYKTSEEYFPLSWEEIEEIALKARNDLGIGLGPISNVTLLLEKNGVIISRAAFNDCLIDACSYWSNTGRPFIFMGSDKDSPSRSRFDVAHELGHLVLHSNITQKEFNKNIKSIEKEADRFAAAFLMPAPTFSREVLGPLDHFLYLKRRWKVSIQAMVYRSKDLGLITEDQYTYLMKKINYKRWRKNEPLEDKMPNEQPILLKEAVELIIKHKVKTKSEFVDDLKFPRVELETLCNLMPGSLIEEEEKGKIVQFKLKR